MAARLARYGRGGALRNDLPAGVAPFGPEIEYPVGLGHYVEVVFDHHHGVACVHQPVQHAGELLHVRHVQTDGRLVQYI